MTNFLFVRIPALYLLLVMLLPSLEAYNVIYAVNCGGEEHEDSNGIKYERDPLKVGTASDFGKNLLMIGRVPQSDEIIYQTERYHTNTFGYDLPLSGDGDYALILKFSEVYFNAPNLKVFDVVLNGDHTAVADLDIFGRAGKGNAYDEYIYFSVSRGRIYYKEEESEISSGKVRIEFIKGYRDNPKINAVVLIKGDIDNIPKLPPQETENQEHFEPLPLEVEEETIEKPASSNKQRKTSGPKQPNPYQLDDNSIMLPVFIAIVAFIPLLFCLCRL